VSDGVGAGGADGSGSAKGGRGQLKQLKQRISPTRHGVRISAGFSTR
jgi:hypothetical protein